MQAFKRLLVLFILVAAAMVVAPHAEAQEKLKALIIDGQNNHEMWPKITFMMKKDLEATGLFTVDLARSKYTWKGEAYLENYSIPGVATTVSKDPTPDPAFRPKFSDYDVVINNFGWNAAVLPKETERDLEAFVEGGGGLVVIHAADNSWPAWKAYNEMIGLGGWGDRDEKSGPYVYYDNNGELTHDTSAGRGGAHGPEHPFVVTVRDADHPITKGMPAQWLHARDELYQQLRGPAENMHVLATSYADPRYRGTDRHEPMLMTLEYGDGRIFHTPMGHADYSVECVGFIVSLQRGAEWAATGDVTQEIPEDFPTAGKVTTRAFDGP